jgi:hypothetical protein
MSRAWGQRVFRISGSTTWLSGRTNYTVTRTSNSAVFWGADLNHDGKEFNRWENCYNTLGDRGQICQTGSVNLGETKTVTAYYIDPPVTPPTNKLNVEICGTLPKRRLGKTGYDVGLFSLGGYLITIYHR